MPGGVGNYREQAGQFMLLKKDLQLVEVPRCH